MFVIVDETSFSAQAEKGGDSTVTAYAVTCPAGLVVCVVSVLLGP